jgi:hypothetical protein
MAEEVKYNNTLVSGRADETLTYTKYVKDESSGKSAKELLDEKVNKTDQLGTTQIADKAVTNEKLAEHSVDNSKLSSDSVSYDKIQNDAVITEKIQNGAVTTEKVEEKAVTNQKLGDQSVDGRVVREASLESKHFANESVTTEKVARKSITKDKLADNAVDASQVVDGSIGNSKLSPDSVTTEKIKDSSVTNEKVADDTLGIEKFDPELRKTIQAATGLPEDLSQMIQDVDKSVKQLKEKDTDLQSQIDDKQQQITANDGDISLLQTRSTQMEKAIKNISASGGASQATAVTYENTESGLDSVTAQGAIDELANKKFDKENISQEFGDSEDKVVSQFALPFREIESPEFIKTIVDSEDHFLFGIQLDGSIEWGKGIPAPIRAKLQEIIKQCQQDKTDILEAVNAAKKELSASITSLQESKVDKEEGKSLIDDEVKECFRVIENEEFIKAITDADDKVLFGIYRATGKPYYPLNEMYHVEQNEEFFALWLDAANHVLLGIRRDGQIIGEIHAVNALKQVISQLQSDLASLQEKLSSIDTNLKELLDVFSLQENPEYMAVETDTEGKILSATNPDGSHYIHNAKSETIPEEFTHIEDPEGRTEITADAENKILGYRDSEGTRHEYKISASHINLSDEAAKEVNEAFKSAGIKMENPSDFSKDSYIELPIPRIAAQVRLYAPKLPTTKTDDIEAEIEYNDKDGNYFRKPVILNAQGSSSMSYYVKNMAIDINDNSKIKFGDFPAQDSFHLKKYYIDVFRGQCVVGYWLMEQVYQTRPVGKRYPYEMLSNEYSPYTGNGKMEDDFYTGAKCHPDGFPIIITWVNTITNEEQDMGIYAWNLKKSKEVYHANKKKAEHIILDGVIDDVTLFGGNVDWTQFEIRNPKSLQDIEGNKYDGDNPKELSNTDANSKKVKTYIQRLSGAKAALSVNNTKETFSNYFIVDSFIDYYIISQVIYHIDGFRKNWIWCTWDGEHWTPTLYDVDSIFGAHWSGIYAIPNSDKATILGTNYVLGLNTLYADEINSRYKQLRDSGVFTVENIISLFKTWLDKIGYANIEKELSLYTDIPSYRDPMLNSEWEFISASTSADDYNNEKTYSNDETCVYCGYKFKAISEVKGIPPLKGAYEHTPRYYGFYNSIKRISIWLSNRISFLDKNFKYNN